MQEAYKYLRSFNRQDIIRILIIGVIYYVTGKFGLKFAFVNPSATAIWAPTGIAIASILLYGKKMWPAVFLGALFTNLTTAGTIGTSVGIAIGNTLEGVAGAYLIKKYANGIKSYEKVRDVFSATLFSFVATTISATIGATTLLVAGLNSLNNYASVWTTWWLGDAAGAVLITPLVVLWATSVFSWKLKRVIEALFLLIMLLFISQVVFLGNFHYTYLAIPILLWAAIRFGPREASTAIFFVAAIATVSTLSHVGPFITDGKTLDRALILLQMYMGTISIMTMMVAAVVFERRKNQEELTGSQKRFKALIEKGSDGIVLLDKQATILYAGPSTEHVFGYKPEEVVGRNSFEYIYSGDREYTMKVLSGLLQKKPGESVSAEYRIVKKDGSLSWMEGIATNLLTDPNVSAVVINLRDINERKLIEQTVDQEKAEDEALLASIGDGIVATDKDEKITLVNKAFEEMLGWREKEAVGKRTIEILKMQDDSGDKIAKTERPLQMAIAKKRKITATHYLIRKDNTRFPALIVATPIILDGQIVGGIKVFHDVTREKEIDQAKTEFVSLASHQLRTPLTIINWSIEMLTKKTTGTLNPKQKKYVSEVYKASKRMVDLTNSLLTISRLELGKITVENEKIDLILSVKQAIAELSLQIKQKELHVKENYSLDKKTNTMLESDPKLLNMVFQNIISNAVKYTPPKGNISIEVSKEKDNKHFSVEIGDNGYGIPKSEQDKIFSKLFRASNIQEYDQQGTGLGLYIVKAVVDRLGGSVNFKSEEKKGTTFFIKLPFKSPKNKKNDIAKTPSTRI